MKYFIHILIVMVFLFIPFASSVNYYKFEFKNSDGNYVDSINIKGFLCSDYLCKNSFVGDLWESSVLSTNTDGTNYDIILSFPNSNEKPSNVNGYIFFSYNLNFIPRYDIILPRTQVAGNSISNPLIQTQYQKILTKISSCSSPISLSVVNNIRENLPVSVTSGASMSSTTKSAFGFQSDLYTGWIRGSQFEQYYEVETTLRLRIFKYDIANTRNIGNAIHTENVVKRIYYDDTVNVAFNDWMPPEQTEQFTYYNITVISDVTDPKCSSKVNQGASKIMRVWRDDPRNACYSLTDFDTLGFSPVDSANKIPEVGQEVTINFR
jgi:hypothetical protein